MGLKLNAQLRAIKIVHAWGMAYLMVEWLDKNSFVMVPVDDKLSISDDVFYPYLAMVSLCLHKSKRAAKNHEVLGFHNCPFKDVHHQLSLNNVAAQQAGMYQAPW